VFSNRVFPPLLFGLVSSSTSMHVHINTTGILKFILTLFYHHVGLKEKHGGGLCLNIFSLTNHYFFIRVTWILVMCFVMMTGEKRAVLSLRPLNLKMGVILTCCQSSIDQPHWTLFGTVRAKPRSISHSGYFRARWLHCQPVPTLP
jgi:hypothetical protein